MSNDYTFTLEIQVLDAQTLFEEAQRVLVKDNRGMSLAALKELIDNVLCDPDADNKINVESCIQVVLDRRVPGCSTYSSGVQHWPDYREFGHTEGFGL